MSGDITRDMPTGRPFEEIVLARFDSLDAQFQSLDTRLQSLEDRVERLAAEEKSMLLYLLAELIKLKTNIKDAGKVLSGSPYIRNRT